MTVKLARHGEDLAIVLDRRTLSAAGISEDSVLDVAVRGRSIVVTAEGDAARKAKFDAAVESMIERYSEALKRLAE
jgi:antitoxin component of MazEF toxin-antitoxin module